jgi:integrase
MGLPYYGLTPSRLGTGQSIQEIRETIEGSPGVFKARRLSRIGVLVLPQNLLTGSGRLISTIRWRIPSGLQSLSYRLSSLRQCPSRVVHEACLGILNVRRLYREKLDSGLSTRTVQYIHVTLHKALGQAVNDGLVPRNVTEAVKPPQIKREEINPLILEQVKELLKAVHGDRLEALYVVAVTAGLRQGELLGLKWEDVDLEQGTLQVRRTLSATKKGTPTFGVPKTAKGKRSIKLTDIATKALKRHLILQFGESSRLEGLWRDHGLVFTTQVGTPLNRHNLVSRSFKPFLVRASLPEIRFHDLRHTCATLMLTGGIHPKVVQEMLGHANVSVTLNTYSHVLPNMQGEAAVKIDFMLS